MGQQAQGGISRLVDKQFDEAFNTTLVEGDLPDVRFGRIDYLNVTYITTKWNTWSYVTLCIKIHTHELTSLQWPLACRTAGPWSDFALLQCTPSEGELHDYERLLEGRALETVGTVELNVCPWW